MNKSCGNCGYWTKIPKIKGLCEKWDLGWATSDSSARYCKGWKRKRDSGPRDKADINEVEFE